MSGTAGMANGRLSTSTDRGHPPSCPSKNPFFLNLWGGGLRVLTWDEVGVGVAGHALGRRLLPSTSEYLQRG